MEGASLEPPAALEAATAPEAAGPRRETLDACRAHAYELAAGLCEGLRVADLACGDGQGALILARRAAAVTGVDPDRFAIRAARERAREVERLSFEVSGVPEFLRREGTEELGAIVLLGSIEDERLGVALELLGARAEAGTALVIGLDPASELPAPLARLERLEVLEQLAAEGSLIRPRNAADDGAAADAIGTAPEEDEPPLPVRLIVCANLDAGEIVEARVGVRAAPPHARRIRELERANWELRRVNAALASSRLGKRDSAASALLARLQWAETKIESMERSASWRLTAPLRLLTGLLRPLRARLAPLRSRLRRRI